MSSFTTLLTEHAKKAQIPLTDAQAEKLSLFWKMLRKANEITNLTAITDEREAVGKHFLDSLALIKNFDGACVLPPSSPPGEAQLRLLDVGSGAGFPGLPLAICREELQVTLLEATGKKTAFLSAVKEALSLPNVTVQNLRAEDAGHDPLLRRQFDFVTARAVAGLNTLSELCLPFAKDGGLFCAYKAEKAAEEIALAKNALEVLGGTLERCETYLLDGQSRSLVLIRKTSDTPEKYPRRSGMPAKKPL